MWWGGWPLTDHNVMNFQHVTMYGAFGAAAIVDLLARRGRVDPRLSWWTLGGAYFVAAVLFFAHGSPTPMSDAVHVLLALVLAASGFACVMEAGRTSPTLALIRAWLTMTVGTWFLEAAWVLALSGYNEGTIESVLKIRLFLIWHLAGNGAVLLALHLRRPGARQKTELAPISS
jgi:hypothetical protein